MDIFQERGHQADVKNKLTVEQLHGIVGNYDGMVIRSATKVGPEKGHISQGKANFSQAKGV